VHSWRSEFQGALAGRRVLVTGATGFIGRNLCEALIALGAEVYGLAKDADTGTLIDGCRPLLVDLRDLATMREAVLRAKPEIIFHLAAMVTARQDVALVLPMIEYNLLGSVHLLLAAGEAGCDQLVLVGSCEEPGTSGWAEAPTSPYAASKAAAVLYGRMFHKLYALPVVVVRLFMAYGPWQAPDKLIPATIQALLCGERATVFSGGRTCDFIYVADVVRGLMKAALRAGVVGETLDLGTGNGTSIRDMVSLLAELSGSPVTPLFTATPERTEESHRVAQVSITNQKLEWEPVWTLRRGLAETIDWYRARAGGQL